MIYFFQCGDRLYTSESDVYSRQILTYKNGLRAKRVERFPGLPSISPVSMVMFHSSLENTKRWLNAGLLLGQRR